MEVQHQLDGTHPSVTAPCDRSAPRWLSVTAVVCLLLVQAGIGWFFVGLWWWHLGNILEAPAPDTLLIRALTAVIFVGVVLTEVVMLARRKKDPLRVAAVATAAMIGAVVLEGPIGIF